MTDTGYSHLAFSDESRHNIGRFRSVAVLTCKKDVAKDLRQVISQLIYEGDLKEFKWHKLRQARDRFVALKIIDHSLDNIRSNSIRIDVLIWDIQDSRHLIDKRDDNLNLQLMYYHLLRNVMRSRWPNNAVWSIHPDEHSSMDWDKIAEILYYKSHEVIQHPSNLFSRNHRDYSLSLKREFGIYTIKQVCSHEEPLSQVADLFAGIAAYSYSIFERYLQWENQHHTQLSLELGNQKEIILSNSENERFLVLSHLSQACKRRKLGISYNTTKGLHTHNPSNPLNFWKYKPQSNYDKAPTKNIKK